MSGQQCAECGCDITEETGWGFTTTLAERSPYVWYCGEHHPNKGKGYTLSDLEQMRAGGKVERARYEMSLMELVGPDVYFHVKAGQERAQRREQVRRMHRTLSGVVDTLKQMGVPFEEDEQR